MRRLVLYLWAAAACLGAACTQTDTTPKPEKTGIPVRVVPVTTRPLKETLHLLGTVEANREMKIGFKIAGKIRHLAFEEGQAVKAGALLAELETAELGARRQKALEARKKARRDLERMRKLFGRRIVSESAFQDAETQFVTSEAEFTIVEDALNSSRIRAPFSGRITRKLSEVGEVVAPGTPIAILLETNPILVKAAVPDNFIQKIRLGQTAAIRVDSCPRMLFKGPVRRIETTADPLSRTFRMEIRLANPGEMLRPGLIARVELVSANGDPVICIPLDAVVGFGSEPAVFVVKASRAERRPIRTGDLVGDAVRVLEGLAPGELLVVRGQEYLGDRHPVLVEQQLAKGPEISRENPHSP